MTRHLINFLKIAIPIGIIVYLVYSVQQNNPSQFQDLVERDKDWGLLLLACGIVLGAVLITFLRWWLLVRAIDLPFRLSDAFRLGFLGFLLNFISPGSVGGDLFKAFFIARDMPNQRTKAVATIVIDRVVGLYALLILNLIAILVVGLPEKASLDVRWVCNFTIIGTSLGGLFLLVFFSMNITRGRFAAKLTKIPLIGPIFKQLFSAMEMYRSKVKLLIGILLMSVVMHALYVVALYMIASSFFDNPPTLAEHFIIIPLGMVFGALPLAPAGLGAYELAMEYLYQHIPVSVVDAGGQGLIVALSYRVITIAIAAVGVCYYFASKKEISEVLHEVEAELEHPTETEQNITADLTEPQTDSVG